MLLSLYTISYALLALCTISNAATLQINIIDDSLPEPELISAEVSKSKLPPCSNTDRPCSCPKPATLHNISTFAVLGANAWAVRGVMGSCSFCSPPSLMSPVFPAFPRLTSWGCM